MATTDLENFWSKTLLPSSQVQVRVVDSNPLAHLLHLSSFCARHWFSSCLTMWPPWKPSDLTLSCPHTFSHSFYLVLCTQHWQSQFNCIFPKLVAMLHQSMVCRLLSVCANELTCIHHWLSGVFSRDLRPKMTTLATLWRHCSCVPTCYYPKSAGGVFSFNQASPLLFMSFLLLTCRWSKWYKNLS